MTRRGNIIGKQVAKLRNAKKISQEKLAAACQRLGWDVSRDVLARVELQIRGVTDKELSILATALGVAIQEILTPTISRTYAGSSHDMPTGKEEED